ncbi:MAG: PQQ-binding-like beta-propeller repeat protein [Planctomycetota bacterium]
MLVGWSASAGDWPGFRGPDRNGISAEKGLPTRFGDKTNLKWKTPLAGPGSSSPVVVGDKVFVTAYTGYGLSKENVGEKAALTRRLYCLSRQDGSVLWQKSVKAHQPIDEYRGYISEHGYSTSTPATDGKRVYVFFGKSGVLAYDFDGNRLWHTLVGKGSSDKKWGSASSPLLYGDTVIVSAADEATAVIALDKRTGKVKWRAQNSALNHVYATPALVKGAGGVDEIVVNMPEEIWGLDAKTGLKRWYAKTGLPGNICPSVVVGDGAIYGFGGYPKHGSFAVKTGGTGNVTGTHLKWSVGDNPYVVTPVLTGGKMYWVSNKGEASCMDAKTGKLIHSRRLGEGRDKAACYASPLLVDGKLYVVTRQAGIYVLAADESMEVLEHNVFESDSSIFNATPAVSNGQMFIRSNQAIYCVEALASE